MLQASSKSSHNFTTKFVHSGWLVLGAASGEPGKYRLEVTCLDDQVYYSRINTATGSVETWKYNVAIFCDHCGWPLTATIPTHDSVVAYIHFGGYTHLQKAR